MDRDQKWSNKCRYQKYGNRRNFEGSLKTKINLVAGEEIGGRISVKFTGATIEDALKILCENRAIVFGSTGTDVVK